MLERLRAWLAETGVPAAGVIPMAAGLGHTRMWRVARPEGDLVLRVYPPTDTVSMPREAAAMRTAGARALPVPTVVRTGSVEGHDVLLMTHAPGELVAERLRSHPHGAHALGLRLGDLLGRLHDARAPHRLAPRDAWVDRAGPALAPIADRLRALPHPGRLLHLDYHPENVLVADSGVTAIIDWTNTLPGPPHLDLGRSRAILAVVRALGRLDPEQVRVLDRFEAGLVTGHAAHWGDDPAPDATLAWGLGVTCTDFAPQVDVPGGWVTRDLVDHLEEQRDRLVEREVRRREQGRVPGR